MRIHEDEKIKRLRKLRSRGYSINELVSTLAMPKTTVWYYVQNVSILSRYKGILKAKQGGSAKRKERHLQEAKEQADKLLESSYRNLAIAIAMLYWGEGNKKTCEFINSDGHMIDCYLTILRKVFKLPEESFIPTMRIFDGMDESKCLNYWSNITRIPKNKFIVRFNDGGTRGRTPFGMCRITVKKGSNTLKIIQALIKQFSNEIIQTI